MVRGLFITGTDTGIGKTVVTAALLRRFRLNGVAPGAMKPIETGVARETESTSDAARLRVAAGMPEPLDEMAPYRFSDPLAPYDAAKRCSTTIEITRIIQAFHRLTERYRPVLVEGAGGLLVPIGSDWSMRELILALDLPVVVIGPAMLGGVNHALLTLEALAQARCRVAGLVLTVPCPVQTAAELAQQQSTVELLRTQAGVPVFGPVPYQPEMESRWNERIEELAKSEPIRELADRLIGAQ